MSVFHEIGGEQELRKRHRFLRAKLETLDKPKWFERRLQEETGLSMEDMFLVKFVSETGPLLDDAQLDALENFIRRFSAGAITARRGEIIEDERSPYRGRNDTGAEVPSVKISTPGNGDQQPNKKNETTMPTLELTERQRSLRQRFEDLLETKPRGFKSRFCKAAGIKGSSAHRFFTDAPLRDSSLDRIETALEDTSWQNAEKFFGVFGSNGKSDDAPAKAAKAKTATSSRQNAGAPRAKRPSAETVTVEELQEAIEAHRVAKERLQDIVKRYAAQLES